MKREAFPSTVAFAHKLVSAPKGVKTAPGDLRTTGTTRAMTPVEKPSGQTASFYGKKC